ncbi:MAG: hypothetical protein R3B47_01210 [Bacteroidia bacterium]
MSPQDFCMDGSKPFVLADRPTEVEPVYTSTKDYKAQLENYTDAINQLQRHVARARSLCHAPFSGDGRSRKRLAPSAQVFQGLIRATLQFQYYKSQVTMNLITTICGAV